MSGALLEIRKRIGSVRNTRKITKAMQLMAATKMRQFQKRAVSTREYVWELMGLLEGNLSVPTSYTEQREGGKILFVLYTSDKGLCGPLNNKLINTLFRSEEWNNTPAEQRLLITLGKKGYDFARSRSIPVLKHYTGVPEKMTALEAIKITDTILNEWKTGEVKQVIFAAPFYKNSITFYPVVKAFLPFSKEMIVSNIGPDEHARRHHGSAHAQDRQTIYEPSLERVTERLQEQVVISLFMGAFLELKASEYSSRMLAMQNATDSADKVINELSRQYNKARQQAITAEIAELVGASDAISA